MNKQDLINEVHERTGINKKESKQAVEAVIDAMADALAKGDEVGFVGFGTLKIKTRAARTGRNPQTQQPIQIPESKTVRFVAGKALKDRI